MINRIELIDIFQKHNLIGRGVEVGSFKGQYANEILKKWSGKLYLVDVWRELNTSEYLDSSNQIEYLKILNECCENIKGNEYRCFMIRADSVNGSKMFLDESLDFVYIDANHKYEYVKQDISLWFPKVRKGGIIAGHDYLKLNWTTDQFHATHPKDKHIWIDGNGDGNYNTYAGEFGVNPAVDEFCAENNYKANLTNEWFGSWYFIK